MKLFSLFLCFFIQTYFLTTAYAAPVNTTAISEETDDEAIASDDFLFDTEPFDETTLPNTTDVNTVAEDPSNIPEDYDYEYDDSPFLTEDSPMTEPAVDFETEEPANHNANTPSSTGPNHNQTETPQLRTAAPENVNYQPVHASAFTGPL